MENYSNCNFEVIYSLIVRKILFELIINNKINKLNAMDKNIMNHITDYKHYFLSFIILTILSILPTFTVYNYSYPFKEAIILFITVIFGCISIYSFIKYKKIHKTTILIIVLFGLLCVFLSPIGSVSDEVEHFTRAEITSQGILFPEYITQNDKQGFLTIESTSSNVDRDKTIFETDWDDKKINNTEFLSNSAFQQNPFYVYIAQAIGVELAKILNLNNIYLLWFARICNLLLYACLCGIAIKKTPMLKVPMAVIACFPLSIIQASSCSCDSFIFGFTLIVISYFAYMYKSNEYSLTKKDIYIYMILVLILGLSKVTFGALILLILVVPKNKFENPNDYYLGVASIIFILICLLMWSMFYAMDGITHSWRRGLFRQNHVNSTEQLDYILHNPQVIYTFAQLGNQIIPQIDALTRFYSEFNTFPLFNCLYMIFATLFVFFYPIKESMNKNRRIIIGFVIIIIILGTYFVQYLTWAPVGSTNLLEAGVVPRYFLSILVLLPLVFNINNKEIRNQELIIFTIIITFLSSSIMFITSMFY